MHAQRGLTLSGFIMWSVIVLFALLLGFKLFPAYYEYYSIQRTLNILARDEALRSLTKRDVEAAYARRAVMENIQAVGPGDLSIIKAGGNWTIEAQYSVQVPLFGNLSACMDFAPHSEGN